MAKIDACLLADILAAQGALANAYLGRGARGGAGQRRGLLGGPGDRLLLKGPIPLIVSGTTVAVVAATDRERGCCGGCTPAGAGLVMLAIALPWFVAIG